MLQNTSYIKKEKRNTTKQNNYEKKKKSHPTGVEPEAFDV